MKEFRDKTAFITGGASGLGFAMAEAFGNEGMNVMLADIEEEALAKAVEDLSARQIRAEGVIVDVANRNSVRNGAIEVLSKFGKVHVVCNNAGVGGRMAPVGELSDSDWRWVIDVNLFGVVYGMETFAPLIESHGEGGHFVNTASLAGLYSTPTAEPYSATKFAVVAMSEGWAAQLAPRNMGVSILCPGVVQTRIFESHRNRQQAYGKAQAVTAAEREMIKGLASVTIPASAVGARVLEGVRDNELYILTHVEFREPVQRRFARIAAAFDRVGQSPALRGGK